MEYDLRVLDIRDDETNKKIIALQRLTFGDSIGIEKLRLNTFTNKEKTLYLGAFKNNELAGFNGFIAHELHHQNKIIDAYQSCWSATHPEHRGKGIFYRIVNEAKQILKERNGGFIFGFPNANSHPIFIKKLGFYEIPLQKIQVPTFVPKLWKSLLLQPIESNYVHPNYDCFIASETQLIELKKQEYGEDIKVYSSYNNSIWGKKRNKTKAGINIPYFSIGGIIVNKPHLLSIVFEQMIRAENVAYIEMIGPSTNSFFNLFKSRRDAPLTEPLIIFDLNIATSKESNFNFLNGIKDVF